MRGRLLATSSAVVLGAAVFIGASYAMSSRDSHATADFPPNLPVSELPVVPLSADQQVQFNDLLGTDTTAQIGITTDSYAHARLLTTTSAGPLYAVPGLNGQCLILWPAASCGDIGAGEQTVALWVKNPTGQYFVGGGLLATDSARATVVRDDGSSVAATPIPGGFAISEEQAIAPGRNIDIEVQ